MFLDIPFLFFFHSLGNYNKVKSVDNPMIIVKFIVNGVDFFIKFRLISIFLHI